MKTDHPDRCPYHSRAQGYRCELPLDHSGLCVNTGDGFKPGYIPGEGEVKVSEPKKQNPSCAACGHPVGDAYYAAVPNVGDMCIGCHVAKFSKTQSVSTFDAELELAGSLATATLTERSEFLSPITCKAREAIRLGATAVTVPADEFAAIVNHCGALIDERVHLRNALMAIGDRLAQCRKQLEAAEEFFEASAKRFGGELPAVESDGKSGGL